MNKKETGGSAFPLFDGSAAYGGMTLRDWFAGMALQGLLVSNNQYLKQGQDGYAKTAYGMADAMIEARDGANQ